MKKIKKYSNSSVRIKSTADGLHLDGSILWFDAEGGGELSFLSSAALPFNAKTPQVIATEETVKILESKRKKPNALVCQYNRPFSIGRLKMELLPSGNILGGALLHVETDRGRILYAPQAQIQKIPTVRQIQLKKAQTLILGAYIPESSEAMPNRKREKERLLNAVSTMVNDKKFPIVLCQPHSTAQEICKLFSEANLSVAVHSSIFKINKIYEHYGSKLGRYTQYSPKYTKKKVLIFPLAQSNGRPYLRPLPEGPVLYIEETCFPSLDPSVLRQVEDRFYLSHTADGKDLKEIISAVSPKEVYIFGPYAKQYTDELKNTGPKITPLYTDQQPTLF